MLDALDRLNQMERRLDRLLPQRSTDLVAAVPDRLLDFVPWLSPNWERPDHLEPISHAFEAAYRGEELRSCVSTPPQHGKTQIIVHGLVMMLLGDPTKRHAYVTYSADRANRVAKMLWRLAIRAGLKPDGPKSAWSLPEGGGVILCGIGGGIGGEAIDGVMVIDDPHKNRQEAESTAKRRDVWDFYTSTAETRCHPGASVFVVHTRWHPDDLAGRLIKVGWDVINLQAIDSEGVVLWPSQRPLSWLNNKRRNCTEYEWCSLYQGEPRPRGATVFGDACYYRELPTRGYSSAHGADLAYTAKTHADYSVVVTMLRQGDRYFVVDCVRKQVDAPSFTLTLKAQLAAWPGRMVWHASGTEKGAAQFIRRSLGPRFEVANAGVDKFQRALPVAAAWNDGRVLLPSQAPWLDSFLAEVGAFTGVGDLHDDMVDALASAFYALDKPSTGYRELRGIGPMRRM